MNRNKTFSAFAALATATVLALTACAPQSHEETPATTPASSSTVKASEVVALPVGDPFDEAAWSLETGQATLTVTPERLVAIDGNTVRAWTADGKEAWSYEAPKTTFSIQVLKETVAVVAPGQSDGEGLDKTKDFIDVTLLALQDGDVVANTVVPLSASSLHSTPGNGLAFRDTEQYSGFIAVAEDGNIHKVDTSLSNASPTFGTVSGIPYWASGSDDILTENWNARDLGLGMSDVKLIDDRQGLLLLSNTSGKGDTDALSMVQAETGAILYTVSCPTDQYGWGASGGNDGNAARNSPNGQYGVAAGLVFSAVKSQCVGGGEQQNVGLTAVGNNGTAYGETAEGELVVVSLGSEPEVSPLPEGASAPIGVMDGNIAIHWDQITGVATGNPINAN